MALSNQIVFFDTTLRDGEQSPGCTMHHTEKLRMAHQLARLGVDIIEAGFAIASQGDFNSVNAIAERGQTVRASLPSPAASARTSRPPPAPSSPPRRTASTPSSPPPTCISKPSCASRRAQAIDQVGEYVRLARSYSDDVEFSTEDGTRSDIDFLIQMVNVAVQAGATTINIPDTVGYTTPTEYKALFEKVRANVPNSDNVIFSTHCHDDLGMAVANSLAGVDGGARQVECTINGIGERAGNAALEEIAAAITTRHDRYPYTSNIMMTELYPTSKLLGEIISFSCSPNKAVVGKNAFAHESGIHQHGVLANPLTYEIMTPASVGFRDRTSCSANTAAAARWSIALPSSATSSPSPSSTPSTRASPNSPTARSPSTTRTCSHC